MTVLTVLGCSTLVSLVCASTDMSKKLKYSCLPLQPNLWDLIISLVKRLDCCVQVQGHKDCFFFSSSWVDYFVTCVN